MDIGDNFDAAIGFVPRIGIKKSTAGFSVHPYVERYFIREYAPFIKTEYYLDQNNDVATKQLSAGLQITLQDSARLEFSYNSQFERLKEEFSMEDWLTFPVGDYKFNFWKGNYSSDTGRKISGSAGFEIGDFYAGTKASYTASLSLHPNAHLGTTLSYTHDNVQQPFGSFADDLVGLRFDYGFTPNKFFNAFIQYNSFLKDFSTNLRFNLLYRPLSNLYIIYNETRNSVTQRIQDRVIAIKFTRLMQF
jgi:hypothetical protein